MPNGSGPYLKDKPEAKAAGLFAPYPTAQMGLPAALTRIPLKEGMSPPKEMAGRWAQTNIEEVYKRVKPVAEFLVSIVPVIGAYPDIKTFKKGMEKIAETGELDKKVLINEVVVPIPLILLSALPGGFSVKSFIKGGAKALEKEALGKTVVTAGRESLEKGGKEAVEKISITLVTEGGAVATKLSKDEAILLLKDLGENSARNALGPHEMHTFNTLLNEAKHAGWDDVLKETGFGEAKGVLAETAPAAGKAAAKEAVEAGERSLVKRFEKGVSATPVSGEVVKTVEDCVKSLKMKGTLKEIVEVDPFKAVGREKPANYARAYLISVEQEGKEFILGLTKGGKGGYAGGAVQVVEDATVHLGIKTLPKHAKVVEIGGEAYTLVPMAEFKGLR